MYIYIYVISNHARIMVLEWEYVWAVLARAEELSSFIHIYASERWSGLHMLREIQQNLKKNKIPSQSTCCPEIYIHKYA